MTRGKFDAKRATELGVMGPDRAELTKGRSVVSKDGVTIVTPEMCIGPNTPAAVSRCFVLPIEVELAF